MWSYFRVKQDTWYQYQVYCFTLEYVPPDLNINHLFLCWSNENHWHDNSLSDCHHLYDLWTRTQQHNIIGHLRFPALSVTSEENGRCVIMVYWNRSSLESFKKPIFSCSVLLIQFRHMLALYWQNVAVCSCDVHTLTHSPVVLYQRFSCRLFFFYRRHLPHLLSMRSLSTKLQWVSSLSACYCFPPIFGNKLFNTSSSRCFHSQVCGNMQSVEMMSLIWFH